MNSVSESGALYVGVDGGASKTVVRVEDASGRSLGEAKGAGASIRLSVSDAWAAIMDAIARSGLSFDDGGRTVFCGIGLAGTEIKGAYDRFVSTPHPFARLVVKSDAYVSCLGAHGGEDGAIVAVGTGMVGYRIEREDESRAGGWGFPHSDEGGGAWLGMEAVRATLCWLDGRESPSSLTASVLERFDGDRDRLVVWANAARATDFATLAPLVVEHAQQGAPLAAKLLRRAAGHADAIASALGGGREASGVRFSLLGSVAPYLEPLLGDFWRRQLTPPKGDAASGALRMIRRAVRGGVGSSAVT